jgi:hypothetical protein
MTEREQILKKLKYLFWDIPDDKIKNVSDRSVLERLINYAKSFEDFLTYVYYLGLAKSNDVFYDILSSSRPLISKKAQNYCKLFFKKHVHRNS